MDSDKQSQLFQFLQKSKHEVIEHNQKQTSDWNIVKNEYVKVKEALDTLPDNHSLSVMVPLGPKALMRGKIVHTNEIMVGLGEKYFLKQSAKGAKEICTRRIENIDKMLQDLNKEYNFFLSQQDVKFGDLFMPDQEIYEPYDEEKEKEWRVQHRQKVKEYKQSLRELKENNTKIENEDDIMKKLDELALQEELEDELARLEDVEIYDNESDIDNSLEDENSEEESGNSESDINNSIEDEKLKEESSHNHNLLVNFQENSTNSLNIDNSKPKPPSKQVSFNKIVEIRTIEVNNDEDDEEDSDKNIIYVHHTQNDNQPEKIIKDISDIESPSDLYLFHKNKFIPKEILKVKTSANRNKSLILNEDNTFVNSQKNKQTVDNIKLTKRKNIESNFSVGDIIERNPNEQKQIKVEQESRPVSKFKKARNAAINK